MGSSVAPEEESGQRLTRAPEVEEGEEEEEEEEEEEVAVTAAIPQGSPPLLLLPLPPSAGEDVVAAGAGRAPGRTPQLPQAKAGVAAPLCSPSTSAPALGSALTTRQTLGSEAPLRSFFCTATAARSASACAAPDR